MEVDLRRFVDRTRIRAAIDRVERSTNAAISVTIVPHLEGDVHAAAMHALSVQGTKGTRGRHAVLFFVVPSRREFAIVGTPGAHETLGQATWNAIVVTVQEHFRAGDPTGGLIEGIDEVGEHLARHFPKTGSTASR